MRWPGWKAFNRIWSDAANRPTRTALLNLQNYFSACLAFAKTSSFPPYESAALAN
jgi:hypothetical protein